MPLGLVKDELESGVLTRIETPLIKERDFEIFIVRDASIPMGPVMKELWERAEVRLNGK